LTLNGNVDATDGDNTIGIGTLALNGVTRRFTVANGATPIDLNIAADITGNAGEGLTKGGTGRMRFTGTNTFTGRTFIQSGFLEIDGDQLQSQILVGSFGTLEGNGAVGATVAGGTVRPGPNNDSLSANGNLAFKGVDAVFAVDMHENVRTVGRFVARRVILNDAQLQIFDSPDDLPPLNRPIGIIGGAGGISGRFNGLPNNAIVVSSSGLSYRVNYAGIGVSVTRVS
jgi:subtilase-type serine protease